MASLIDHREAARWRTTAARIVQALRQARDDGQRLALLNRLARRVADRDPLGGYPSFLKLLIVIAESDEHQAKRSIGDAMALGLRRMDLPSGTLNSWGAGAMVTAADASLASASLFQLSGGFQRGAPQRQFGPLEYLTVWFCQRTQRPYLGEDGYRDALGSLVDLFDQHGELRRLYPLKLRADASEGLNGAYTRATRDRLLALAEAWQRGDDSAAVAASAAAAVTTPRHWITREL